MWTPELEAEQRADLPILATKENCEGKTYIVTGANFGLGLEASRHFVNAGSAKVIMAVRNMAAGEEAKKDIESTTGIAGVAEVWYLDLASYESTKAFAKKAIETLDRIDAVVENAGVALDQWKLADGHESSMTINVYSTFLLAVLLMPKLRECATKFSTTPHITIVSSGAGFQAKEILLAIKDDPLAKCDDENGIGMRARYPLTKLIEIFAVRGLAPLIPVSKTGVVVNLLSPGLCVTGLNRHVGEEMRNHVNRERERLGRTAEMGSRTLLHAAMAGKESHGCYVGSCTIKEHQVPAWVDDAEGKELQKRLWEGIAKELEIVEPGCVKSIL